MTLTDIMMGVDTPKLRYVVLQTELDNVNLLLYSVTQYSFTVFLFYFLLFYDNSNLTLHSNIFALKVQIYLLLSIIFFSVKIFFI